jgi:ribosomal protein L40E
MNHATKAAWMTLAMVVALGAASLRLMVAHPQAGNPAIASPGNETSTASEDWVVNGMVVGTSIQPKPGEICLVCNRPVEGDQLAYLVDGQRVAVHRGICDSSLRSNPRRWLARLKPHGAFLGAEPGQAPLAGAVFYAGLYVLIGLVFGALSAHCAFSAGHQPLGWFALGFFFNIAAYLFLISRPRREVRAPGGIPGRLRKIASTFSPETCPRCGAGNHPSAAQCLGCGTELQPKFRSEVEKAGLRIA